MSFVTGHVELPPGTPCHDGVISAADIATLVDAQQQARALVEQAHTQAEQLVRTAEQQARQLQQEAVAVAQAQARELAAQLQGEWDRTWPQLRACALAVARIAFDRVAAHMDAAQRIEAAVSLALRELPSPPVRLWVPEGAPTPRLPEFVAQGRALAVACDGSLASHTVAAEDGAVTIVSDFDAACLCVSNDLLAWMKRVSAEAAEPPGNAPELAEPAKAAP